MTQPNQDAVRAASAAFGRGDMGALQDQFFVPDIVWHIADTGPLAGDYEGAAQVMGLLGKISALCNGPVQPELHDVLASPDHTVALTTIRAERAGKQLQLNLSMSSTPKTAKRPRSGLTHPIPPPQRNSGHNARPHRPAPSPRLPAPAQPTALRDQRPHRSTCSLCHPRSRLGTCREYRTAVTRARA